MYSLRVDVQTSLSFCIRLTLQGLVQQLYAVQCSSSVPVSNMAEAQCINFPAECYLPSSPLSTVIINVPTLVSKLILIMMIPMLFFFLSPFVSLLACCHTNSNSYIKRVSHIL